MNVEKSNEKKSSPFGWLTIVIFVFVGARQLHSGGIRGLMEDFFTEKSSKPEIHALRDKILATLRPMGVGLICFKEHGKDAGLRSALESYNKRNQEAMKKLVASIEARGGMSKSEKDLLDRQAYREARSLTGRGLDMDRTCNGLGERFNSGEFDLN